VERCEVCGEQGRGFPNGVKRMDELLFERGDIRERETGGDGLTNEGVCGFMEKIGEGKPWIVRDGVGVAHGSSRLDGTIGEGKGKIPFQMESIEVFVDGIQILCECLGRLPRLSGNLPEEMAEKVTFSNRLKQLRNDISVKDLAKNAGVAPATLYNAEADLVVTWNTIERAYGPLCKTEEGYAELLMLWAMTQSKKRMGLYRAQEAMTAVLNDSAKATDEVSERVLEQVKSMDGRSQDDFAKFAVLYRTSPPTRQMAAAWMESVEKMREE